MKTTQSILIAALALASMVAQAAPSAPAGNDSLSATTVTSSYHPDDYKVYVDKPTGFAYIKTPVGWKFIRRIESTQLAQLPAEVTTPPASEVSTLASDVVGPVGMNLPTL